MQQTWVRDERNRLQSVEPRLYADYVDRAKVFRIIAGAGGLTVNGKEQDLIFLDKLLRLRLEPTLESMKPLGEMTLLGKTLGSNLQGIKM